MDEDGDAMQVDIVSAVEIPPSIEAAVKWFIETTRECLRQFIESQIEHQLGRDMLSLFMPGVHASCVELLKFIEDKWISIFCDSSMANLRHTASHLEMLIRSVNKNSDKSKNNNNNIVCTIITAKEIGQAVEAIIIAISPGRAARVSHVRQGLNLLINNHNHNEKRMYERMSDNGGEKMKKKVGIALDGSNIGWRHGNGKTFSLQGTFHAYEYFRQLGHDPVVIFLPDARLQYSCRHTNSKYYDEIDKLRGSEHLVLVPDVDYDDSYICSFARQKGLVVVSNDAFRDVVYQASAVSETHAMEWQTWLNFCRLTFTFHKDGFVPNPSFNWTRAMQHIYNKNPSSP